MKTTSKNLVTYILIVVGVLCVNFRASVTIRFVGIGMMFLCYFLNLYKVTNYSPRDDKTIEEKLADYDKISNVLIADMIIFAILVLVLVYLNGFWMKFTFFDFSDTRKLSNFFATAFIFAHIFIHHSIKSRYPLEMNDILKSINTSMLAACLILGISNIDVARFEMTVFVQLNSYYHAAVIVCIGSAWLTLQKYIKVIKGTDDGFVMYR